MSGGPDDLALLRAYEPVLRLSRGEYFVPVGVDHYVERCALWRHRPDGSEEVLAEPGTLDLDALARLGAQNEGVPLSLSGLDTRPSRRDRVKAWLFTDRPRFRSAHRLAQVGLFGRLIDLVSRLSLLIRGAVPGGSAVTALAIQREHLEPSGSTYHGRVLRDDPWVVLQYWYFYSFNNWRSGFSGVNEHEADWEQVTIYLDATRLRDGLPEPRWVVFSAHDETGDDLRRRWDDPDLELVDGAHPVVYAGAGSHSGAYLPGDYLITVEPPRVGGLVPALRHLAKVVTPWSRAAQGEGLGMPYVDYARGDGLAIGPSGERAWTPALIDDTTPWVRDYRGLWGHDTRDRLGGERGPAGPRYERDGTVRQSWGDPVGWAGLAKVSPNPAAELDVVRRRVDELDTEIERLAAAVSTGRAALRRAAAGLPAQEAQRELRLQEAEVTANRMQQVHLEDERRLLRRVLVDGCPEAGPHDHLQHRRTPIAPEERNREWLLGAWSVLSTPLMLGVLAWLFYPGTPARLTLGVLAIAVILSVEAFARGYLLAFVVRLLIALLVAELLQVYLLNWQWGTTIVFGLFALTVLVVNVRDAVRR
jgi:hypothetical protein